MREESEWQRIAAAIMRVLGSPASGLTFGRPLPLAATRERRLTNSVAWRILSRRG